MRLYLWLQVVLLSVLHEAFAKKDKALYCAVCRALVEEVNGRIGDVDPRKVVEIGSFRVDPHGNQKLKQKKYARSEVHLTEIFEDVCYSMTDHVVIENEDGSKDVVRRRSRAGKAMDLKNVKYTHDDGKLKRYCAQLVEDHEEEMIPLFGRDNLPTIETAICGDITSACTEEQLSRPLPTLSEEDDNLVEDKTDADKDKAKTPNAPPEIPDRLKDKMYVDPETGELKFKEEFQQDMDRTEL